MKLSSDKSESKVGKEDVLMHIFKDVANKVPEDEAKLKSSKMGSHCDVLAGKQSTGSKDDSTREKIVEKKSFQKKAMNEPKSELELWSTIYQTEEWLPAARRKRNVNLVFKDNALLVNVISTDSLKPMGIFENVKKYKNPEELCHDCRWLVRAAQSLDHLASDEDEVEEELTFAQGKNEIVQRSTYPSLQADSEFVNSSTKKQVMKLLNQAQSAVLECCILLTTRKLHCKVRKDAKNIPEEKGILLDVSEDDGFSKSTTKLSQDLGSLITRYLKIS